MKRILAFALALLTMVCALPALSLAAENAPACTLVGTPDLPPVDNQGGVGCCASNAITYTQFTNAVSRYLHAVDPTITWNPSSGAKQYLFSPKYTYTYSGAGTAWVYDILKDHGCLTLTDSGFFKAADGGSLYRYNDQLVKSAVKWDVENDLMQKALNFRIKDYEQIWVTNDYLDPARSTVNGEKNVQITTSDKGRALLAKIKDSIDHGNVVVTGGMVGKWLFGEITGAGTLGQVGDKAIIGSAGTAGGGHQVAIVGYDDGVECSIAGITMRGAFQVVNSWGEGWGTGGYAWMFYDALNTVSEYEAFNEPGFYNNAMYLDTDASGKIIMNPAYASGHDQTATFKRVTNVNVNGTIYKAYTIYSEALGGYLAYSTVSSDYSLFVQETPDKNCYWAMIPYEDLATWNQFSKNNYDEKYLGSYWLCAVNRVTDDVTGYRFLDAGVSYGSVGRQVGFASLMGGAYPMAKSWYVEPDATVATKQSPIGIFAGRNESMTRTWTMDQFCFLDWAEDITAEMPELYVKVNVTTTNRESVYVTLHRRSATTGGGATSVIPSMIKYGYYNYHPDYDTFKWATLGGGTMTFSGVENGTAPETASLYFSYGSLLNDLPSGKNFTDYEWGVAVAAYRCTPVTVNSIELLNQAGEVLASVSLPADGLTLTPSTTSMSSRKTSTTYYMTLPTEANSYEVALESGGMQVTAPDRSFAMGESYTFKVEAPQGYVAENVIVRKDGVPLLGKNGVYSTVVASDCEITVTADLTRSSEQIPGDLNGDGTVSIQDVTKLLTAIARNAEYALVNDINGDGSISIQDVTKLLMLVGGAR